MCGQDDPIKSFSLVVSCFYFHMALISPNGLHGTAQPDSIRIGPGKTLHIPPRSPRYGEPLGLTAHVKEAVVPEELRKESSREPMKLARLGRPDGCAHGDDEVLYNSL